MSIRIAKYLARHRDTLDRWPLQGTMSKQPELAVVIPALAEYPGICDTLEDLAACPEAPRAQVIVVVNHREDADAGTIANTGETLTHLAARRDPFALSWCEAVLPRKDGVGLARKIGMDHAAALLAEAGRPQAPIVGLDADTRVDADYLSGVLAAFAVPRWGVVFNFAHPLDGPLRAAILAYELYLRYCERGLRSTGSPYAYTAMGSAMACAAEAYAVSGGMRRKQAGEDFYFLQALAKCGPVERAPGVVVRPAARVSGRVPFGTGRSLGDFTGSGDDYLAYAPKSYAVIGAWLRTAESRIVSGGNLTVAHAPEPLRAYLDAQGFDTDWPGIAAQTKTTGQRHAQFHAWFDAFRTLKALHHLRDTAYPLQPLFEGIARIAPEVDAIAAAATRGDFDAQERLLRALRSAG
ncbi:MAG: hypothetical protein GC168_16670 [Candidatus Hydrogenedens sp.]|nr:hypothetical protein [Candidatus Hydrogenedens sp.]